MEARVVGGQETNDHRRRATDGGEKKRARRRIKGAFASDVRRRVSDGFSSGTSKRLHAICSRPTKKDSDHCPPPLHHHHIEVL